MRLFSRVLVAVVCCFTSFVARPAAAQDASQEQMDAHYRRNSALLSAGTLTTIAFNASDHAPGWVGALGVVGGTLQVVYGTRISDTHATTSTFNYFIGGAAILTSLSALSRGTGTATSSSVQVTPLLAWDEERHPLAGAFLRF